MTPDLWLESHSYLRPLADLSAQVDLAAARIDVLGALVPDWEHYRSDFRAGVPLLLSTAAAVDLEPGGRMAGADWTSLNLDVIARDRGLKRLASSLYEL
jgi:hypothetical protein